MIRIDRCICFDRTLEHLKSVADRQGVRSIEDLQEHVTFGVNCGLCRPYVSRMLETGETLFTEIITEPIAEVDADRD